MQLSFIRVNGWGGPRRNAGRPNKSGTIGHRARAKVDGKKPLHITMKVRKGVAGLRTRGFLKEFHQALKRAQKFGLHINHYSVLNDHIHIVAEADANRALSRGMKSLGARLGRLIRHMSLGHGPVFKGRFHLHVLATPTEVKNALEYVLLNRAKHHQLIAHLDEFSSARFFAQWPELIGRKFEPLLFDELKEMLCAPPDCLSPPRSWLGRIGWQRAR